MLLVACSLSGCGYTIQTRADLPFDTISVGRIENKTLEPKLQDSFNRVLAETLAEYGFRVSQSRYVLEGEITDFTLRPVTEQASVATQYETIIRANFKLIDKVTNRSIPLVPSSPFITYFGSSGRLESAIAQKEFSTPGVMRNLSQIIAQQIIYNISASFSTLLLTLSDLKDPGSLALKLQEPRDPVSRYIREQLNRDAQKLIDGYDRFEFPSDQLKNALVAGLNQIVQKPAFYNEKRFAETALSDKTKKLIRENPKGEDRVRLNRMLLEDAYPEEISSIIPAHLFFTVQDAKDPGSLALKLQEPKDPVSEYVRVRLSSGTLQLVDTYSKFEKPQDALKSSLVNDLNALLRDPSLYNERRFSETALSDKTKKLIRENPKGEDRVRLNRMLLEDAYPEAFGKMQKTTQ